MNALPGNQHGEIIRFHRCSPALFVNGYRWPGALRSTFLPLGVLHFKREEEEDTKIIFGMAW